jgi:hypothetical protein
MQVSKLSYSDNPYVCKDGPKLQQSVVAFVDILGYKKLIKNAQVSRNSESLLRRLHCALMESREHVDPKYANVFHKSRKPDFSAIRGFSDNIVIGYPTQFFGKEELIEVFRELSRFQLKLVIDGFFVRGGISIGDLYMDDIVVHGPALIEAVEAEKNLAWYPRIMLAESARKAVDEQLHYYPLKDEETPFIRYLRKDADGQYYVDYLNAVFATEYFSKNDLKKHRTKIEDNLKEHQSDVETLCRYLWVAQYHNEFCDFSGSCTDLKINSDNFRVSIRRSIIED